MKAVIVGSGPSAAGFAPPDGVTVIAVNGVIEWISRADYWFTLDPSPENMERMRKPRDGVRYCAAVGENRQLPAHVTRYLRVAAGDGVPEPAKGTPAWWFWRWQAVAGLSDEKGRIHTGNSAYGALGLAYHLGARRAVLIGVDASGEKRIEGGHSRNLSHLPMLFASALPQMEIVSCGRLDSVPQMTTDRAFEWLMQPA